MKRTLTALVTAGAIATAGMTPTTAAADPARDALGLFIGIAAIAALAESANHSSTHVTVSNAPIRPRYVQPRQVVVVPVMPRQCLVKKWTRSGWVKYYAGNCMTRLGWVNRGNRWEHHAHNNGHNPRVNYSVRYHAHN